MSQTYTFDPTAIIAMSTIGDQIDIAQAQSTAAKSAAVYQSTLLTEQIDNMQRKASRNQLIEQRKDYEALVEYFGKSPTGLRTGETPSGITQAEWDEAKQISGVQF